MVGSDDDWGNVEWIGRPQDDPALHRALAEGRARFRAENPPFDCWIDGVTKIELFQRGTVRARVSRSRAEIAFLNDDGAVQSSIIYLRSENPYEVAEQHLGIAPVTEVRDESNEAEQPISSLPREREERDVAAFAARYGYREDEIFCYLRSAVGALRSGERGGAAPHDLSPLLAAITSAALYEYEAALAQVRDAAVALDKPEICLFMGPPALRDCRRAIVAIERHLAIQNRLSAVRWKPEGGKGGG